MAGLTRRGVARLPFAHLPNAWLVHYLSVFARALGIEFEDQFKKYRLWGDPDRVLEDMAPCQQANGVDPEKARALVMATFARRSAPGGAATAS